MVFRKGKAFKTIDPGSADLEVKWMKLPRTVWNISHSRVGGGNESENASEERRIKEENVEISCPLVTIKVIILGVLWVGGGPRLIKCLLSVPIRSWTEWRLRGWGLGEVEWWLVNYLLKRTEFYQTKLEQGNVLFESMRWGWGAEGGRPEQSEMCACSHWARRHNGFQVRGAGTRPMDSRTQNLSKDIRQKRFDWGTSRENRSLNLH